jgi:hypothetical protein
MRPLVRKLPTRRAEGERVAHNAALAERLDADAKQLVRQATGRTLKQWGRTVLKLTHQLTLGGVAEARDFGRMYAAVRGALEEFERAVSRAKVFAGRREGA